jgi:cob(I)alamin adenosyltransferase
VYNEGLEPLTSFVLPGGSPLAANLHMARTIVRRAERQVVELMHDEPGSNGQTVVYLNRLSDLLFVLARVANNLGRNDVLWVPGRHGHGNKDASQS